MSYKRICLLYIYWLTICPSNAPHNHNSKQITTLFGRPIGDKTNVLTVGFHGPILLQDIQFIEEISHFDRERIPERVVHAKGSGAFGTFKVTNADISKYTKAALFQSVGKETEVAVRFSTVVGEQGAADTVFGDPRGFAVKFYTEEGNFDLVGLNLPVFHIRDPFQFPSFIHANKRNPQSGLPDPTAQFDFFSLRPETLNFVTHVYSDFGIPDGFRHMPGFSINAFKFVNRDNEICFVKFFWITNQGIKNLDVDTATKLRGTDPDYARQDLFDAIESGHYPSWILMVQIITGEEAYNFPFNPFDATKFWPIDKFPLIEVGVMTLNKNPNNFFADVEQMGFDTALLVPGIEPSPDLLLIGRMFAYGDTQRYRLGTNHQLLPVNRARDKPAAITQQDGAIRTDGNLGNTPNYYPNSFSKFTDNPKFLESNFTVPKGVVFRYEDKDDDNYSQPREVYNSFSKEKRENLHRNIALAMIDVLEVIRERMLKQLDLVDHNYADGVRNAIKSIKYHG